MDKEIIIPEEEQTDKAGNEPIIVNDKKTSEEEKEKGFKEGLSNNSDTEKK